MDDSKKMTFQLIAVVIGVVAFFFGALLYPPDFSELNDDGREVELQLKGKWTNRYANGIVDSNAIKGIVDWRLNLKYLNRAEKGTTVLVYATPEILSVKPPEARQMKLELKNGLQRLNQDLICDSRCVQLDILSDIGNGAIEASLHFPSGKVSPAKIDRFTLKEPSIWSLFLPAAGSQSGAVHVNTPKSGRFDFERPDDLEIAINVYEPLFSRSNVLSFIGLVLGPLISIPGIYAFLRDRRRDKEEKEKAKDDESKIIPP